MRVRPDIYGNAENSGRKEGFGILGNRAVVIRSVFLSSGWARGGMFGAKAEETADREADGGWYYFFK